MRLFKVFLHQMLNECPHHPSSGGEPWKIQNKNRVWQVWNEKKKNHLTSWSPSPFALGLKIIKPKPFFLARFGIDPDIVLFFIADASQTNPWTAGEETSSRPCLYCHLIWHRATCWCQVQALLCSSNLSVSCFRMPKHLIQKTSRFIERERDDFPSR